MSVINRNPAVETSGPADQGTQRIPAATVSDTSNPDIIGRIHSVETCGTVDGPGIRFIVFMQGCLMRCKYCHNRDTWDTQGGREVTVPELMQDLTSYRHFMNASGGGVTGQAGAVAHGIARALQKLNPELRAVLKKAGHLTRDPREKERKKPGQPGARKRFQFSKR